MQAITTRETANQLAKIDLLDLENLDYAVDLGRMPKFKMVPKDCLFVDFAYQRRMDGRRSPELIRKIVETFSWSKFQPLTVVERPDGRYAVVDGQHRAAAAILHPAVIDVPCWVVSAPEAQAQAKVFAGINADRNAVTSITLFKAMLAANDPDAIQVKKLCDKAGVAIAFYIAGSSKKLAPGHTMAVSTIRKMVVTYGEKHALAALRTLASAYSNVPGQIRAETISALTQLFHLHGDKIDRPRLVKLLAETDCEELLASARQLRALLGGSSVSGLLQALIKRYGKGLSEHRRLDAADDAAASTAGTPQQGSVRQPLPRSARRPTPGVLADGARQSAIAGRRKEAVPAALAG